MKKKSGCTLEKCNRLSKIPQQNKTTAKQARAIFIASNFTLFHFLLTKLHIAYTVRIQKSTLSHLRNF